MAEASLHGALPLKRCRVCGEEKPLSAFPRHRQRRDGHDSACQPCVAENGRKWYRQRQQSTDGLYSTYVAMKCRCHDEHHEHYRQYGGRGIRVCEEWRRSFAVFLDWAMRNGYRSGLQIDRIDNDRGYCPENCRFVTALENARNKRLPQSPRRTNPTLTEEHVKQIRRLHTTGVSQRELGRRFGVNHATIWAIKCGRTWIGVN
jgi:hypothetical protein